jgi:methylamine dehydrogenase accessory protein MauD
VRRVLILLSTAVFVSTTTVRPGHAQESGIAVGSRAPAVEVHDLEGKPVALGRYLGKKPVFLEFWATWCELCEQLLPRVKAAKSAYGDKVEFIGINVTVNQTPEKVRKYVDKHQPGYLVLYDDRGTSIRAYQVPSTSYVVIVDREGKVAYTGLGGTQEFDAVLRRVTQG